MHEKTSLPKDREVLSHRFISPRQALIVYGFRHLLSSDFLDLIMFAFTSQAILAEQLLYIHLDTGTHGGRQRHTL